VTTTAAEIATAMSDENEFFREATLRICGDLKIETALEATFAYMRGFVPVHAVFLAYFDPARGAMRTIVKADANGGRSLDLTTPHADPGDLARILRETFPVGRAMATNGSVASPFTVSLLRDMGYEASAVSFVSMVLFAGESLYGAVAFVAEGQDRFTEDHCRLVSPLAAPFAIALRNALVHQDVLRLRDKLADDNRFLHRELLQLAGVEIIGADDGLLGVMRQVRQVAPTDSPVLLTGETGVGKDVIANAIHLASTRRDGPFVAVNCGAIPESLLDSELFGHEKGAFTGAVVRKRGRFERADKGTILLDEIGEMPLDAQVRLLRVIQQREIERLGGTERIPLDIRVVAATNRDLAAMVEAGRFRKDLWFRLNVFPIVVPPLRERSGDIPDLVKHFIERKTRDLKFRTVPRLATGAIDVLRAHDWPGNVRELENVVERAMILHRGEPLRFDDLGTPFSKAATAAGPAAEEGPLDLESVTARHIAKVLEMTGGKIHGPGGAAELLAVNANTLRYRMQKLGIPYRKRERT
jgi:transcriptional regulator with GAF, ATPase, and Fis domain